VKRQYFERDQNSRHAASVKEKRLIDAYRFPGFAPHAEVPGTFGLKDSPANPDVSVWGNIDHVLLHFEQIRPKLGADIFVVATSGTRCRKTLP
jgi:hypothetical protein